MPPVPPVVNAPAIGGGPEEEEEGSLALINMEEWFATTVGELRLGTHELAAKLHEDMKDVTLEEALRGFQAVEAGIVGGVTAARRTNEATHATFPQYYLTVKDDEVQVVYGVKVCIHTAPDTQVIAALMGDRRRVNPMVTREPIVVHLAGTNQVQSNHFGGVARAKAKELNSIITELSVEGMAETLAAAVPELESVTALRMLPVHPKVALLFLRGMSVLRAARLVQRLVAQVPVAEEEGVVALVNFCRVACTAAGVTSAAKANWLPLNPGASDQLYAWCEGQKQPFFPRYSLPVPVPTMVLPQVAPVDGTAVVMLSRVTEAMENMASKGEGGKGSTKWSKAELGRYARLAGVAVTGDLTSAMMTEFYQGLESEHKNKAKARIHVETHLMMFNATGALTGMTYRTVYGSSVVEAIRELNPIGSDTTETWELREKGFSAYAWVLCYYTYMHIMFGPYWILHQHLRSLLVSMQKEKVWTTAGPRDIASLIWGLHRATREALGPDGDLTLMNQVVTDFSTGKVPDWRRFEDSVISQLPACPSTGTGNQTPQTGGSGGTGGGGGNGGGKKRSWEQASDKVSAPDFVKAWSGDVTAVYEAYRGAANGKLFFPTQENMEKLLGSEFMALVPGVGPTACGSYFLLGRCHQGCTRNHTTTATPSQQVVNGIRDRMKAHCRALIHAKNG